MLCENTPFYTPKIFSKKYSLGGVHKGRHLLLGGEGVCQMVTQSDMEGGRGLAKGDVTSKCPKNEQIFPQESAASHKFV